MENKGRSTTGFSMTICIGSYGGFHFTWGKATINLCLGWIAFTIFFCDIQALIHNLFDKIDNLTTKTTNT